MLNIVNIQICEIWWKVQNLLVWTNTITECHFLGARVQFWDNPNTFIPLQNMSFLVEKILKFSREYNAAIPAEISATVKNFHPLLYEELYYWYTALQNQINIMNTHKWKINKSWWSSFPYFPITQNIQYIKFKIITQKLRIRQGNQSCLTY